MVSRLGGAASGTLGGAGLGFTLGGPIGAGVGGLAGGLAGYFGAEPDQYKQLPTKSPEQLRGLNQVFGMLNQMGGEGGSFGRANNYLSSILQGGQEGYDQFSKPYLQQFEQQLLPRLAERFGALGGGMGGGVGSSSGFGQALGGAGADLQAQLAQLYQGLQSQAAGQVSSNYNNLAQLGLGQQPFENIFQRGTAGAGGSLLEAGTSQLQSQGQLNLLQTLLDKYLKPTATGTE